MERYNIQVIMSNTSKEMSSSINSDAIDAVTEGINRVGILDSEVQICANCGKEGSDVTNTCNKCKSVMYCNAACKKKHRHKHKKECEQRVAELHDEELFKQPPPEEDCPICFLRLPCLTTGRIYMECCGKIICCGCIHAVQSRAVSAGRQEEDDICPFCRTPPPKSDEEMIKRFEKRIELSDTRAIYNMGCYYDNGLCGLPRDHAKALELWHRAGELGRSASYYNIGNAHKLGEDVEVDEKKAIHYWELAAMGGAVMARYNLGVIEAQAGNTDRALKHYMIAAKGGDFNSLENTRRMYTSGRATKDDYTEALRSYQEYLDEIKSDQRDEAAAAADDEYYESAF